jgi:two-component system sensor histidine kinase AlgZ
MNTIAALIRGQPQTAEQSVEDLADLFRISLSDARHQIRLEEELAICQQYARIESLRLGERLRIQWDLDGVPLDALVPSLCLQPLLENAIYHGIEGLPGGGTIQIKGVLERGLIRLMIENPLPQRRNTQRKGNKIALENTRQRLLLAYGEQGLLKKEVGAEHYRVSLQFPYRRPGQASGVQMR